MKTAQFPPYSFILVILIFFGMSCKEIIEKQGPPPISIGDDLFGGKVAYIFQANDKGFVSNETHGIIAANEDKIGYWGCLQRTIPGEFGTSIGSGKQNTLAINSNCLDTNILANQCSNLVIDGYEDWNMPSKDELEIIIQNRKKIGGIYGGLPPYASSSQIDSNYCWGIIVDIDDIKKIDRYFLFRTRPIRYF